MDEGTYGTADYFDKSPQNRAAENTPLEDSFQNWRNPAYGACYPGVGQFDVFVHPVEFGHTSRRLIDRLFLSRLFFALTSVQPLPQIAAHPEQVSARVLPDPFWQHSFYFLRVGRDTTPL